ncbi:SCO family protein [Roseobacter sp. YSTF-M11]|uniref:SCO family protein n=1 Tax=Roseobacter insulae TaxID=2859783 RepID=A0A9X1K0P3_9RHOB|nr:SCO family protein [Roseobacter insulae]MBW4706693.1 SCO family protein [Roseobacter insulae]
MRYIAPIAAVAVVGLLAGVWYATQSSKSDDVFAQCRTSQIAGGAATIGGPFELVNAQGQTVTDRDVIKEPALIYFGYTFCPDVCPIDTARNADAVDILAGKNISVTPVFISIDPKRDTPDVVGDFAENLHERMIGLTGSPEQVKAASEAYRTYYKAHDGDDDYYLVDHSTFSYLVLPELGFVEFFRREATAQDVADTVSCFVENS